MQQKWMHVKQNQVGDNENVHLGVARSKLISITSSTK